MPELPEVEVLIRSLSQFISTVKIKKVKVNNRNLRHKLPKGFEKKLINNTIKSITRRSKYIIFQFESNNYLLLHLGMSGILFLQRKKDNKNFRMSFYHNSKILQKHNHVLIYLDNGYILIYNDPRRFGFCKFIHNRNFEKVKFLKKLGPEPLSDFFNYNYFKDYIIAKKKNVKSLLMDQSFVSGLGNIYVNEILSLSKINPLKSCNRIQKEEIKNLIYFTKRILKKAIKLGGSSIKNYKNLSGQHGSYQEVFRAYGRDGKFCLNSQCLGKIKKIFISNRSSFYCNKCQR